MVTTEAIYEVKNSKTGSCLHRCGSFAEAFEAAAAFAEALDENVVITTPNGQTKVTPNFANFRKNGVKPLAPNTPSRNRVRCNPRPTPQIAPSSTSSSPTRRDA